MSVGRVELFGVTGAGKSTLVKEFFLESLTQKFLPIFEDLTGIERERQEWAKNPASKTFFIQCVYYIHRADQIQAPSSIKSYIGISDFGLETDHNVYSKTFAEAGLLTELEYAALSRLYLRLQNNLPPLLGLIYRRCTESEIIQHLNHRGDNQRIPDKILASLIKNSEIFVQSVDFPVLEVDDRAANDGLALDHMSAFLLGF